MRHVLKTSTAIVMILSLMTPVTTMAEETDATTAQTTGEAAAETAAEPPVEIIPAAPETRAPEAKEAEAPQAEPQAETPQATEAQAEPAAEPAAEAEAEPAAEQTAPEQPVTQEAPAEKPAVVEAPAPEAKPDDAQVQAEKAEALAAEAEKKPEAAPRAQPEKRAPKAKPETADAVAPEAKPAASEAAAQDLTAAPVASEDAAQAMPPAAKPAEGQAAQSDAATGDNPDALRDALAAEAEKDGAKADAQPETEAGSTDKAADSAKEQAKDAATQDAQSDAAAGQADAASAEAAAREAEQIAKRVENLAAPETEAKETAAEIEAAGAKAPVANDALKAIAAGLGAATGGKVTEMTVNAEDARRSDEDFMTSVAKSISGAANGEAGAAEAQAKSDTKADKDNKGRDIARLALAGMAGLAVGSMLSNNRQVALNTGDRVVVTLPDGSQQLIKNDDTLLFQPGSNVQTENFSDGSTITTVARADGSKVVTIRDANMNVLRRSVEWSDGRQTMLIDDTAESAPVRVSDLPPPARPIVYQSSMSEDALREALMQQSRVDRHFTLDQIRDIARVRALVPPLDIQSITFETGSAAVQPDQARQLSLLGRAIAQSIADNPDELFLIEGYTDAIGSDASNLALSDRRAESVALALSEYFQVPPENLVVQGYGERFLRIQTDQAERANRRVAIRRITELMARN